MTEHALTDDICDQIQAVNGYPLDPQVMRGGADWQLIEVLKWLDANYYYYTDRLEHVADLRGIHKLTADLKKAMRPAQEDS